MKEELYRKVINPLTGEEILEPLNEQDLISIVNDMREMKMEWTPEMIETVKKLKPFDYKKHEDDIKKHISSSKGPGTT